MFVLCTHVCFLFLSVSFQRWIRDPFLHVRSPISLTFVYPFHAKQLSPPALYQTGFASRLFVFLNSLSRCQFRCPVERERERERERAKKAEAGLTHEGLSVYTHIGIFLRLSFSRGHVLSQSLCTMRKRSRRWLNG